MSDAAEDDPSQGDESASPSLTGAYVELNRQLRGAGLSAEHLKNIGSGFRSALPAASSMPIDFLAEPRRRLQEQAIRDREMFERALDAIEPDTRPDEIVANTARAAELMTEQNAAVAQLVELTLSNLALSKSQQEQSERTEKFTVTMTWISVVVAVASLATAIVAIVVSGS